MNELLCRMLGGAVAGFVATMPMTSAMTRMHARLPASQRYPLPPREISASLPNPGMPAASAALGYHFLYGALAGAAFGALFEPRRRSGALFGLAVWGASYLGWAPALGVLRPATTHPAPRNGLMLVAHLVWGLALAGGMRELQRAENSAFSLGGSPAGGLRDRRRWRPRPPAPGTHGRTPCSGIRWSRGDEPGGPTGSWRHEGAHA